MAQRERGGIDVNGVAHRSPLAVRSVVAARALNDPSGSARPSRRRDSRYSRFTRTGESGQNARANLIGPIATLPFN